jgi:hypothetical protein
VELRGSFDSNGYRRVTLSSDSGRKGFCVHQLVMLAFVGPRPEGMEVRHLDGDKLNNALPNLRYDTHLENMRDLVRHGTHGKANRTHCPSGHPYDDENTLRQAGRRACRMCHTLRSRHARAVKAAARPERTHCNYGHSYGGENLYVSPQGHRSCIPCRRASKALFEERRRNKAASLRARARELRDTKPPAVGHARGSGLCPTTGTHPTALGGQR